MYYYRLFFILLSVLFPTLHAAQHSTLPSHEQIQEQIARTPNDSLKVIALSNACLQFLYDKPENVAQYADQALEILDKSTGKFKGINIRLQLLTFKMFAEKFLENYKAAQKYAEQIIFLAKKNNLKKILGEAYSNTASLYADQEQYDSTIIYDLLALKIRTETNSLKIGRSYNNLGTDYKKVGQYQTALSYYFKAIAYKKGKDPENTLGNTYFNIGNIHQELTFYDSAFYYYEKTLKYVESDSLFIGQILHSIGKTHYKSNNLTKAQGYLIQALDLFKSINFHKSPRVVITYQELAKVYLELGALDRAKTLLKDAEKILEDNNLFLSSDMKNNFKILETLFWKQKDFVQMHSYSQKHINLVDSLHKIEVNQKVYQLLIEYEDELKQQRIETLEQQQQISELKNEKLNRQRLFLVAIAILMLFLIGLLYQVNKWRSKVNLELKTLNNTKDKLFSIIAHDLKNPLSAFRSITQSLSDDLFSISKEDLEYFIKQLNNSANNLFDLLQNLLYWSISESGLLNFQPQKIVIHNNIQEVFNLLRNSATIKNIQLHNQVSPEHTAIADKRMLHTILRNLIANAIKFTPNNGQITIQTSTNSKELTISVKDTGIGMSQEQIDNLFKLAPNASNRNEIEGKGTGLGLVLCKELVEQQNGTIGVKSNPNEGSTFYFTLPNS